MQNKQRIVTAIIFMLMLISLPLITLFSKKETFSETENRTLAKKSDFSISRWFDKSFMNGFDKYFSDHFINRIGWIETKIGAERAIGKDEINGIYITDERLIEKIHEPDEDILNSSLDALSKFAGKTELPVYLLIAPTSAGIYADELPDNVVQPDQKKLIGSIYEKLDPKITTIDVYNKLLAAKAEYIYYRNDHHWTSLGAYYAYTTAVQKLGFTPVSYDKFDIEHVSDSFRGTFYSKTLYKDIPADIVDIYNYTAESKVLSVDVNDGREKKTYDSMYFREYLSKKDKYSTFLGTNQPLVTIKTNVKSEKKLLIFKDSYANALVPFLSQHYSEISLLDMRYVDNYKEYVDLNNYSQILFLYNSTTFADDENIRKLAFEW